MYVIMQSMLTTFTFTEAAKVCNRLAGSRLHQSGIIIGVPSLFFRPRCPFELTPLWILMPQMPQTLPSHVALWRLSLSQVSRRPGLDCLVRSCHLFSRLAQQWSLGASYDCYHVNGLGASAKSVRRGWC